MATASMALNSSFVWTPEKIDELIELFSERPCLYNSNLREYNNREERRRSLDEIATALGISETDAKNKLKNLRTQYTREKLKASRKLSETGTSEPTFIRWTHFDKLKFLDEFVSSKSVGAKTADGLEEDVDSSDWFGTTCGDADEFGDKDLCTNSGVTSAKKPGKQKETFPGKRVRLEPRTEDKPADSDDIFAQYIASEIKGISDKQAKRVAKWKIHNAIFEAQTGLPSPYSQYHPQYQTVHIDNNAAPVTVNDHLPGINNSSVT